ncbi:tripartite tricarboxylate transporter substrate binding protein [Salipaludibacillus aurantiacus]|uniref:Tripartite-type tricarboxylate transporter, receptor component TctC n=1 Tax=Salipaludibacillus aurantiacus TaxID=1601833 RepID=A0A1H9UQC4_9BACI|nr:tripartite tricarboxylate transporter substrate binding protein [Salipaludibacillus aurantiacus]SES11548.1 Tripartite-type tricarboxylate transporter, receptor component TctC [Salipaludibacillus aurantiacus]
MFHIKKLVLVVMIAGLFGMLMVACNGGNDEASGENNQPEENETNNNDTNEANEANDEPADDAADYPDKSVQMVVPYSAGGGTDTVARAISEFIDFEESLVVSNIEGSGGAIGTMEVVNADPDGHTLLMHSVTAAVSGYHTGLFDTKIWQDLEPVASMVTQSGGIVVREDSDWETVEDLVEYAQANPQELSVGLPGIGGGAHIISAIFADAADIEVNYVPFDGSADSRAALAGGHIDVMAGFVSEFYDFIQEGEFRMLASTGSERSPQLPDVPTFTEMDIDFVLNHRNGIFAPQGTPEAVIDKLNERLEEVTQNEEFITLMDGLVTESAFLSADEFKEELEELDAMIEPVGELIRNEE